MGADRLDGYYVSRLMRVDHRLPTISPGWRVCPQDIVAPFAVIEFEHSRAAIARVELDALIRSWAVNFERSFHAKRVGMCFAGLRVWTIK